MGIEFYVVPRPLGADFGMNDKERFDWQQKGKNPQTFKIGVLLVMEGGAKMPKYQPLTK